MEPKSIAFYTAVAVSILAVISATTLPTLAHAIETSEAGTNTAQSQSQDGSDEMRSNEPESSGNEQATEEKANTQSTEETTEPENEGEAPRENTNGRSLSLPPSTSVLSCGETITESVTLTTSMVCPEGFTISGENVEFNLNGNTISSGAAEDSSASQAGTAGITVANAVDARITGLGAIEGYGAGIRVLASDGTQVQGVQLTENGVGLDLIGATGADMSRSSITNNIMGIRAVQSSDVVLAFNQIVANMYRGISFEGVTGGVIAGNSLFGNGGQTEEEAEGSGMYLDPNTSAVNSDYNSAWGNSAFDINHADGLSTSVTGNTFGPNNNCGTSTPAGLCNGQTAEEA